MILLPCQSSLPSACHATPRLSPILAAMQHQVMLSSRSFDMSPGTMVMGMGRLPEFRLICVTKGPGPDFSVPAPRTRIPIAA